MGNKQKVKEIFRKNPVYIIVGTVMVIMIAAKAMKGNDDEKIRYRKSEISEHKQEEKEIKISSPETEFKAISQDIDKERRYSNDKKDDFISLSSHSDKHRENIQEETIKEVNKTETGPSIKRKSYNRKKEPAQTTSKKEEKNVIKEEQLSFLEIGEGKNSEQPTTTNNFLKARVEEDVKIIDGVSLILRAKENSIKNGIEIKKGAILYGGARSGNGRMFIDVHTVKNTDGKNYSISLSVYDNTFYKGLRYETGKMSEAAKESAGDFIEGVSEDIPYGEVAKASRKLLNAKERERALQIKEGYIVYLK